MSAMNERVHGRATEAVGDSGEKRVRASLHAFQKFARACALGAAVLFAPLGERAHAAPFDAGHDMPKVAYATCAARLIPAPRERERMRGVSLDIDEQTFRLIKHALHEAYAKRLIDTALRFVTGTGELSDIDDAIRTARGTVHVLNALLEKEYFR